MSDPNVKGEKHDLETENKTNDLKTRLLKPVAVTEPPPHGWLPDIQRGWEGGTLKRPNAGSRLADGQTPGNLIPSTGDRLADGQISGDPAAPSEQRGEARTAVSSPRPPPAKSGGEAVLAPTGGDVDSPEPPASAARMSPPGPPQGRVAPDPPKLPLPKAVVNMCPPSPPPATPTAPPLRNGSQTFLTQGGRGGFDRRSRLDPRWARLELGVEHGVELGVELGFGLGVELGFGLGVERQDELRCSGGLRQDDLGDSRRLMQDDLGDSRRLAQELFSGVLRQDDSRRLVQNLVSGVLRQEGRLEGRLRRGQDRQGGRQRLGGGAGFRLGGGARFRRGGGLWRHRSRLWGGKWRDKYPTESYRH